MADDTNRIFVQRDEAGRIVAVSLHPLPGFEPCLAISEGEAPEDTEKTADPLNTLVSSDLSLIRVLEDLIDLLVNKDLIRFTELPEAAKQKLLERRSIRSEIKGLDLLGDEGDQIIRTDSLVWKSAAE